MASSTKKKSTREKVQNYRARMRARGLRPVQVWVPDKRTPEFIKNAHIQSLAVARSVSTVDDQAFIDDISEI